MKARPILFNGQMVRALLDGRKTQTRRVLKPQPKPVDELASEAGDVFVDYDGSLRRFRRDRRQNFADDIIGEPMPCPYGSVGDLLYVRETWSHTGQGAWTPSDAFIAQSLGGKLVYRADEGDEAPGWFPSIHMPRWASRLTLRITDVRVERLKDITKAEAAKEGWQSMLSDGSLNYNPKRWFRDLWDEINGPGAWEANPWVWAVSFKVIHKNVDQVLKEARAAA